MTIFINKSGPNGNIFAALAIAKKVMRSQGKTEEDCDDLWRMVKAADNPNLARGAIEHCTDGEVQFIDAESVPQQEDKYV